MSQVVTATYENGVLKLDQQLPIPQPSRVRLVVELIDKPHDTSEEPWREFDELADQMPIHTDLRLTRDQLYEQRPG